MSKLKHSQEQADFGHELEVRFNLNIPYDIKNNSAWLLRFIELFSYDKHLPREEAEKTGTRLIESVKKGYYWDTPIEHIAHNLNTHPNDIKFIVDILEKYSVIPLKKEDIGDEFPDVTSECREDKRAYKEIYYK